MTLTQEQLEWIVSEVVSRLRSGGPSEAPSEASAGSLSLSERLVTLETLRGRLGGVSELRVAAGAVVTPAVVDLLKTHNVQLVRGCPKQTKQS